MNFNDVAIVSIKWNDYRIHFWYMSKMDAIALMSNSNLKDKNFMIFFSRYIKMNETTYYQRNRDMILNRAKDYYENNKELLRERERERAKNKYRELPEKEKINKVYKKQIEKPI